MHPVDTETAMIGEPLDDLARAFTEECLRSKGYTWATLKELPEPEAKRILAEVSLCVSVKLAEVESTARLTRELHGERGG